MHVLSRESICIKYTGLLDSKRATIDDITTRRLELVLHGAIAIK